MSRPTKASGQASYREIAQALSEQIRTGELEAGSLIPTERELQERFGATRSVVRRALADVVEKGWGETIPNKGVMAVQGPDLSRTLNVAFVDHRSSFNRHLFVSLSVRLQQIGRHLVLVDSQDMTVEGALEYANSQGFAAAFVWSKTGYPNADRIRSVVRQMPVIALDHSLKTILTDVITDDNYGGAWLATHHLARLGRKRIAISGMFDMTEPAHDRFGGYLQALFDSGLAPVPRNFLFIATSATMNPDTHLLTQRLYEQDRPDAIFVLQDEHAQDVADVVLKAGLRIPQDVAIIAFREDTIPSFGGVALSSVASNWDQFADLCAQRLLERFERPKLAPETFRLPTQLHIRGSCGAPPEQWINSSISEPMLASV